MTVAIEVISPGGLVLAKIEFLQKDDGWISVVLTCGGTRASFLWLEADGLLDSRARYLTAHILDKALDLSGAYIGVVDTDATRPGWAARIP